jgi:lipid II isoglutaminyl synthase (glutamine-hydrolysing)
MEAQTGGGSAVTPPVEIVHLYPDLLRTYGDRGNVLALRRRLEWRGVAVAVAEVGRGDDLPEGADIIFIGGGSDRIQRQLSGEIAQRRQEISEAAEAGAVVLGVCGGFQLLGHSYTDAWGTTTAGMGLLDITTTVDTPRLVGRAVIDASFEGHEMEVVGFENHGGRTFLGPEARALGRVRRGLGNNGADGSEGAVQGRVLGTYLHGPLLPSNPALCDALLQTASSSSGTGTLSSLDDRLEWTAHDAASARR